jgi:uncharacterized protein YndB with AHSA1/START domain
MTPEPQKEQTRSQQHTIGIAASPDAVWHALTSEEGLKRWFAPEAKVEPGEDGSIWVSWGAGAQGTARIAVWRPGEHLRTIDDRPTQGSREAAQLVVDYLIEARAGGGVTMLRLVHSGFGAGAEWDGEFDGVNQGWPLFLVILKHGLEHNADQPSAQMAPTHICALTPEAAMDRILGPQGFCAEGALKGLAAGDRFRIRTADGDLMEGRIERAAWPHMVATVDNWNQAMLALFADPHRGQTLVTLMLVTYGDAHPLGDAFRRHWETRLPQILG